MRILGFVTDDFDTAVLFLRQDRLKVLGQTQQVGFLAGRDNHLQNR
jgi:hypothetical protein